MAINDKMQRLGYASRRLNDGSDRLDRLIGRIDKVLGQLMLGLDYVHPTPLDERVSVDGSGKRIIEMVYVGYLKVEGSYHLAVKTVKVLESKSQMASEQPGSIIPLLVAPRRMRHKAVDLLPEVVSGLAMQVDEVVGAIEHRCATAEALLEHLQEVAEGAPPGEEQAAVPSKAESGGTRPGIPLDR